MSGPVWGSAGSLDLANNLYVGTVGFELQLEFVFNCDSHSAGAILCHQDTIDGALAWGAHWQLITMESSAELFQTETWRIRSERIIQVQSVTHDLDDQGTESLAALAPVCGSSLTNQSLKGSLMVPYCNFAVLWLTWSQVGKCHTATLALQHSPHCHCHSAATVCLSYFRDSESVRAHVGLSKQLGQSKHMHE